MAVEIVTLAAHDDEALRAWYAVEGAATAHDRPVAVREPYSALVGSVRPPSAYRRTVLLLAELDGERVGAAAVRTSLQDNLHLADLEIHVHPDHRRRGVGTALHDAADDLRRRDGRTTVLAEVFLAIDDAGEGLAFAVGLGFSSVHVEEHLVLDIATAAARREALGRSVDGYEILTWRDRCPDEHVEAFCRMRNQMEADVPIGDVDAVPRLIDVARIRAQEERMSRSYHQVVAAARRTTDGAWGGYSVLFVGHGDTEVWQDDTLVMPDHRGHGLGLQLKVATLDVLLAEHPDRRRVHTWTDPDNHAMRHTNAVFGFTTAELMHEMQREDPDG